jgi:hypothetical protein
MGINNNYLEYSLDRTKAVTSLLQTMFLSLQTLFLQLISLMGVDTNLLHLTAMETITKGLTSLDLRVS